MLDVLFCFCWWKTITSGGKQRSQDIPRCESICRRQFLLSSGCNLQKSGLGKSGKYLVTGAIVNSKINYNFLAAFNYIICFPTCYNVLETIYIYNRDCPTVRLITLFSVRVTSDLCSPNLDIILTPYTTHSLILALLHS